MDNNNNNEWLKTIGIIALIIFLIFEYNSCQEKSLKARAYDIMEENPGMDMKDALEQAEYEHDEAIDAMNENSRY